MPLALWIVPGAACGALARFYLAQLILARTGGIFPWGTLLVNWLGCWLMGLLAATLATRGTAVHDGAPLLLGVGFLGSFTTFSAFGLETVRLMQTGHLRLALIYVLASVLGGLGATWWGQRLG